MNVKRLEEAIAYNRTVKCNIIEKGIVNGDTAWRHHSIHSPFHRLYFIQEGTTYVRGGGRECGLEAGRMYLIPRGTRMDYYTRSSFRKLYYHVNFYVGGGRDLLDGLDEVVEIEVTEEVIQRFVSGFKSDSLQSYAMGQAGLFEVLGLLVSQLSLKPSLYEDVPYYDLIELMIERNDISMSVESMAAFCEQSVSDFSRKFKKATGLAPKQLLHKLILEAAQMKLLTSEKPIKTISTELGFDDSLYFSRFFSKRTGMSPTAYRESQLG